MACLEHTNTAKKQKEKKEKEKGSELSLGKRGTRQQIESDLTVSE
jgi:hypothetical protein